MKIVIAACILESPDRAKLAVSLHWRQDVTETEMRGISVEATEKDRPDWRIAQVVVATIPQEFVLAPKPEDSEHGYWVCGNCKLKFVTLASAQNHPCCQPSAPAEKKGP